MDSKLFQRRIEDFTCAHCQTRVQGDGYTNHCPACLWSRHVDIQPGDRANPCQGMLEPRGALLKKGSPIIVHHCQRCGEERRVKSVAEDNQEILFALLALGVG